MNKRGYTSYLIKAIMLLLALIVMAIVASLAWFIDGDAPAEASGLSVSAETPVDFDIAVGFKTSQTDNKYVVSEFAKKFDLTNLKVILDDKGTVDITDDDVEFYNAFFDFSVLDVTGNGIELIRPDLMNKNSEINNNTGGHSIVQPNQDYISFDMLVRSNQQTTLYLDSGSSAYGKVETENKYTGTLYTSRTPVIETDTTYTGAAYVSSFVASANPDATFSADAVVGGLRVAFINYDTYSDEEQTITATSPDALWIPRSDIRFEQDTNNPPKFSLYSGIVDADDDKASYYIKGADGIRMNTYRHHYYDINTRSYTVYEEAKTIHELNKETIPICQVNKRIDDDDEYYYGKVHINIWLEGCDSEARRALRGGEFVINFDIKSDDTIVEPTD